MLKVAYLGTNTLIPYSNNPRAHSDKQVSQVAASIKEFGFNNPILIDEDKGVIAGHGRLAAAQKLELVEVPTITLTGLSEAQKKAYVIVDNQLALNSEWQEDLLKIEIERLGELDFDLNMLAFDDDFLKDLNSLGGESNEAENPYSQKVDIPVYEPTGEKPSVESIYDNGKSKELIEDIEKSGLPEREQEFLKYAAYRHTVYNFEEVANFYAHSSPKCQELMENSALVIIDIDKAIENGYVSLSEKISEQYSIEYPDEG